MENKVYGSISFMDGTSLKLEWQRLDGDPVTLAGKVKRALEKDRFMFETEGDLMIIPVQNIKHVRLSPCPQAMPKEMVIRNASIVG